MKNRRAAFVAVGVLLVVASLAFPASGRALDAPADVEGSPAPAAPAPAPGWLERDTLTGDWGGGRTWLEGHGITLTPRLTLAATPWFVLGADLQVVLPALATTTAVFPGLRGMIRF